MKPLILTYHGIVPKIPDEVPEYEYRNFVTTSQFEKQIRFLLKKYHPLRVEDFSTSRSSLERGFLITFDDGFLNNYRYATPLLKKYDLQGFFFITTKLIGTREFLWTEQVNRLIMRTTRDKIQIPLGKEHCFDLNSIDKREQAAKTIRGYMKTLPRSGVQKILTQLSSQLSDVELEMKPEEEERYLFMNWEQVRGLAAAGQVVGSHTHTHPILSNLSEDESFHELKISKEMIEKHIDNSCEFMSYPNGTKADYSDIHIRQLKLLGYRRAFTQINPFTDYANGPYELNRVNISLRRSKPVFNATLCGFKQE